MPRLAAIQLMRALAALMVLVGHVISEAEHYFGLTLPLGHLPWTRGVDVFFVISGFIIALSGRRYFGRPGGTQAFVIRRIIRVVPLYWLFTTLMLITIVVMPGGLKETTFDPGQIVTSYVFLPYARPDGRLAPILSLGWTLNYEVFFYLLFAAFLTIRPPLGMVLVLASIVTLALSGATFDPETAVLAVWTNSILIEFAFGILLAEVWLATGPRIAPSFGSGAVLLALGLFLLTLLNADDMGLPRFVVSGLPALLIVSGPVLFWDSRVAARLPRLGSVLGDSSYALYLSHRFVLRAATLAMMPFLPVTMAGAAIYVVVVCTIAAGVGILVFRHVETPMLTALNRRFLPAPLTPAQV